MRNRATNQEKEIYGNMNETDSVEIDANLTSPWFITEAAGTMGAPGRPDRLIGRVTERMRRRTRPEQLISNDCSATAPPRRSILAAYAAKLLFGISIAFNAMR